MDYRSRDYLHSAEFPFHIEKLSVPEALGMHSHEFVELVYVAEGEGRHEYLGQSYQLGPGDVFVIQPGSPHAYAEVVDHNLWVYNVLFEPKVLLTDLGNLSKTSPFIHFYQFDPFLRHEGVFTAHLRLTPTERIEIVQLLDATLTEYTSQRLGSDTMVKAHLLELLVQLTRFYDGREQPSNAILWRDDEVITRLCGFVEQNLQSPISLAQVCQLCGMSQSAFALKFKKQLGMTFVEYRNQLRVQRAKALLETTDYKVIEIAQEVGFTDISFFNRSFKKFVGISPRVYRTHLNDSEFSTS